MRKNSWADSNLHTMLVCQCILDMHTVHGLTILSIDYTPIAKTWEGAHTAHPNYISTGGSLSIYSQLQIVTFQVAPISLHRDIAKVVHHIGIHPFSSKHPFPPTQQCMYVLHIIAVSCYHGYHGLQIFSTWYSWAHSQLYWYYSGCITCLIQVSPSLRGKYRICF